MFTSCFSIFTLKGSLGLTTMVGVMGPSYCTRSLAFFFCSATMERNAICDRTRVMWGQRALAICQTKRTCAAEGKVGCTVLGWTGTLPSVPHGEAGGGADRFAQSQARAQDAAQGVR